MKAVVQRVTEAKLSVGGELISEIGKGFVVYFGVADGDGKDKADFLAKKIGGLRVFEDEEGNLIEDVKIPKQIVYIKTNQNLKKYEILRRKKSEEL